MAEQPLQRRSSGPPWGTDLHQRNTYSEFLTCPFFRVKIREKVSFLQRKTEAAPAAAAAADLLPLLQEEDLLLLQAEDLLLLLEEDDLLQ